MQIFIPGRIYTFLFGAVLSLSSLSAQGPTASTNVNMVSGTKIGTGDPFLTKQNEPSIAVSSLNPAHLLGGSNDSRLIDFTLFGDIPGENNTGDSWVSVYKSVDGGRTWRSGPLPGCPLNLPICNSPASPAKGYQYASDPTVRSGPYGTFFYSYIAGNRGENARGIIAVQRFVDRNDNIRFNDDPFQADVVNVIAEGNSGQFKDKPWNAVDQPGRPWNAGITCTLPGRTESVPAFSAYVAFANFVGNATDNPRPSIYVARSHNCGATFEKEIKVSTGTSTNQGATVAVDPTNGWVYVAWRQFFTDNNQEPHAIFVARSRDGGKQWDPPVRISAIVPFDQGPSSSTRFRSNALPTMTISVDANGKSRVHVAWAERYKGPEGPAGSVRGARIMMATSSDGGLTWPSIAPIDFAGQSRDNNGKLIANNFNPGGLGHQLQPALAFAGGKLTAAWLDQRNDHTVSVLRCPAGKVCASMLDYQEELLGMTMAGTGELADSVASVFGEFVSDAGLKRRHTLDVYGAQAVPADNPVFSSFRISNYAKGALPNPPGACGPNIRCPGPRPVRQLEFNAPNLPIYVSFTAGFIGDYIDLGGPVFLPTPGDPAVPFKFNNASNSAVTFHAVWTDNRDVRPPKDGIWVADRNVGVKRLGPDGVSVISNAAQCIPGLEGIKNQNVYTSRIGDGLNAFALVNSKLLSSTARRFTLVLQNNTATTQLYRLDGSGQTSGANVFFLRDGNNLSQSTIEVNVPGYSSASRTAWVTSSSDPKARVEIKVTPQGSSQVLTTIILNPDPKGIFVTNSTNGVEADRTTNDMTELDGDAIRVNELTNNELTNNELTNNELTNNELTNNELTNNELTNNELTNNELTNNELTNNELTNNELTNTALTNNELTNNELTNNELTNNELTNNELTNNELTNSSLADATFVVTNKGNTDSVLNVKSIIKGSTPGKLPEGYRLQLVVHKLYRTPTANSCNLAWRTQSVVLANVAKPEGVDVTSSNLGAPALNKDEWNANVPMAVNDTVRVTYRILSKEGNPLDASTFAAFGIKTLAVGPDGTTIPVPLLIQPADLPAGTIGTAYSTQLVARGGPANAVISWAETTGLPPGLQISSSGAISGTPTTAGTYTILARVRDSVSGQTDIQKFSLLINKAALIVTALNASRFYGAANPVFSVSYQGLLPGQTSLNPAPVCTTTATVGSPVSTYPITCTGSSATYSINFVPGTLTVNPAPLEAVATATSVYGNTTLSVSFTYNGLVNNDPVSVVTTAPTCTASIAANSPVAGSPYALSCSGGAATNYTFNSWKGSLTIQRAPLVVTAENKQRDFGAPNPQLTFLYSQFVNNETAAAAVTTAPVCTTTAAAGSPVGNYPITCNGGVAPNYAITYVAGVLTVGPANVTISAVSTQKLYGAAVPALAFVYGPFPNGLTSSVVTTAPTCVTTATANSPVANYGIACSGAVAPNLTFSYTPGILTVNPAPLTIAANNATMNLGSPLPALTATYTGVTGADTVSSLSSTLVCTTNATANSPIGLYDINCTGGASSNYDPVTRTKGVLEIKLVTLTATAGPNLSSSRSNLTATVLSDGTVFIAGGFDGKSSTGTAEIYDPQAGTITVFRAGLKNKVSGHTATALPNRKVLIAGGGNSSAELVDLVAGTSMNIGGLSQRSNHTATLLPNGRVLIAGGASPSGNITNSASLFDPTTNTFLTTGNLITARQQHVAVLLTDGRVLILGGRNASGTALNTAEIYNPTLGTFSSVAVNMSSARFGHQAIRQSDGSVLVMGGNNGTTPLSTVDVFNPTTNTFSAFNGTPAMLVRQNFTANVRPGDGLVLVIGGRNATTAVGQTQVFANSNGFLNGPTMLVPRSSHASVLVTVNGVQRLLVVGGLNASGQAVSTTEIYSVQ